jgi:hypothetical protein
VCKKIKKFKRVKRHEKILRKKRVLKTISFVCGDKYLNGIEMDPLAIFWVLTNSSYLGKYHDVDRLKRKEKSPRNKIK